MNAEDVRNVTFDKAIRGYRPDAVDAYLDKVAEELEKLGAEKAETEKNIYILAEKVEQYRKDEETLKTALLNAQRMGESVIHEARQKAETIVYDATSKASQAKEEAADKVAEEEMLLARLKAEVAHFKGEVLNLYKQHIESLSMIPGAEPKKKKEAQLRAAQQKAELELELGLEKEPEKKPAQPAPAAQFAALDDGPDEGESADDDEIPDFSTEFTPPTLQKNAFEDYRGITFDD